MSHFVKFRVSTFNKVHGDDDDDVSQVRIKFISLKNSMNIINRNNEGVCPN